MPASSACAFSATGSQKAADAEISKDNAHDRRHQEMHVRIVIAGLLMHVVPQLPGSTERIERKDAEEDPGELQPEHSREPHKGAPYCLTEPFASSSYPFSRTTRLMGGPRNLLGRRRRCRPARRRLLRTRACALSRTCCCRCPARIRRGCGVHSPHQRFRGRPRSYSKRPAKAYRIHTVECSRSSSFGKDSYPI